MPEASLLKFPCQFMVKAMGYYRDDLDALVVALVRHHVPELAEGAISTKPSRDGKYLSVSVSFTATSRDQLDGIYQDLSDHPLIIMAL